MAAKTPSSPTVDKLVTLREPWSPCVGKEEAGDSRVSSRAGILSLAELKTLQG